jgi:Ca2+-binding EF-hand superfamily protein
MMEAMSQEAIEEMVDSAFKAADLDQDGLISFQEFKRWVCGG